MHVHFCIIAAHAQQIQHTTGAYLLQTKLIAYDYIKHHPLPI